VVNEIIKASSLGMRFGIGGMIPLIIVGKGFSFLSRDRFRFQFDPEICPNDPQWLLLNQ